MAALDTEMPTVTVTAVPRPTGTVSVSAVGPVIPSLQQVTDTGSVTTDTITAAGFIGTASYATSAAHATLADQATTAVTAGTASYATAAGTALIATQATTASTAGTATTATTITGTIPESQVSGLPAALQGLQTSLTAVQSQVGTAAQASVVQALAATVTALQATVGAIPTTTPTLSQVVAAGATTTGTITAGTVATTAVSTAASSLTLSQNGDFYGPTSLTLENRAGANGATFSSFPKYGADLIDFGFKVNGYPQCNIRLEQRAEYQLNANDDTGEFQFLTDTDDSSDSAQTPIAIGAVGLSVNSGAIIGFTTGASIMDDSNGGILMIDSQGSTYQFNNGNLAINGEIVGDSVPQGQ